MMNPSNNPMNESPFDKPDQPLGPASGLEEQLRLLRPGMPRLDIDAIARLGGNAQRRAARSRVERTVSASQFYGTIAASWACGVVVGSACVFHSFSSPKQVRPDSILAAANDKKQIVAPENERASTKTLENHLASEARSLEVHDTTQFDFRDEPLRVGMSLASQGKFIRALDLARFLERKTKAEFATDVDSSLQEVMYTPPTPATRAELLKELIQTAPPTIH